MNQNFYVKQLDAKQECNILFCGNKTSFAQTDFKYLKQYQSVAQCNLYCK